MPFDNLCALSSVPLEDEKDDANAATTFECDYDKNPTSLYEAIEEQAWLPGYNFFQTGKWEKGIFFSSVEDPLPAARQARTWVTRFEPDGKVRWSQLPIHAALIFGAPYQFVAELVKLYPQGVRCTDDQHMLPLHLAMKFGAEDNVVVCLLESFPESIFTKDIRGRLPTEVECTVNNKQDRSKIMEQIIAVMAKTLTRRHGETMNKNMSELKEDLFLQNNLNKELEQEKKDMEVKWQKALAEIATLKSNVEALRKQTASKADQSTEQRQQPLAEKHQQSEVEKTTDGGASVTSSVGKSVGSSRSKASNLVVRIGGAKVTKKDFNKVPRRGFFKRFNAAAKE